MFRFFFLSILLFFVVYGVSSFFRKHFPSNNTRQHHTPNQNRRQSSQSKADEKHFSKNVGEYVNYEEIKDDYK